MRTIPSQDLSETPPHGTRSGRVNDTKIKRGRARTQGAALRGQAAALKKLGTAMSPGGSHTATPKGAGNASYEDSRQIPSGLDQTGGLRSTTEGQGLGQGFGGGGSQAQGDGSVSGPSGESPYVR